VESQSTDIAELVLQHNFDYELVQRWVREGCWRGLPIVISGSVGAFIQCCSWIDVLHKLTPYRDAGFVQRYNGKFYGYGVGIETSDIPSAVDIANKLDRGRVANWFEEAGLGPWAIHDRINRDVSAWKRKHRIR
jgi:hypothetical protein